MFTNTSKLYCYESRGYYIYLGVFAKSTRADHIGDLILSDNPGTGAIDHKSLYEPAELWGIFAIRSKARLRSVRSISLVSVLRHNPPWSRDQMTACKGDLRGRLNFGC